MAHKYTDEGPVSLTDANKLYLYKLLSDELGTGKQAFLPKALEALASAEITPEALGYAEAPALFAALDDICQLTTFKGGRFYVTVTRREDFEQMLAAAESAKKPTGQKGGKPWKRKKGALKPVRPRFLQPKPVEEAEPEPEPKAPESESQKPAATEPTPAEPAAQTPEPTPAAEAVELNVPNQEATAPETTAAPEPVAAATRPQVSVANSEQPKRIPSILEQIAAQEADLYPGIAKPGQAAQETDVAAQRTTPEPAQGAAAQDLPAHPEVTATSPSPRATGQEVATPTAPEAGQIATAPVPGSAPATTAQASPAAPAAAVAPAVAAAAHTSPEPPESAGRSVSVPAAPTASAHDDLPHSFADDVSVKPALLGLLTRILPFDCDLMGVLTEDLRVARATGQATGSRSRVTFPLRYLQEDGSAPVTVTIRRTSRPGEARRWQLALVDGDDGTGNAHEAAGIEGLPEARGGYWTELSPRPTASTETTDPIRDLAQFMSIGSWETFLGTVATAAAPERWNYPGEGVGKPSRYGILREYLAATLARVRATSKLAVSADGKLAAFDTGLASPMAEELYAVLEATGTDIPWRFLGLAEAGNGELGSKLVSAFGELPARASYLESIDDVRPRPDAMLIPDYRSLLGEGIEHLPASFLAGELSGTAAEAALAQATGDGTPAERKAALRTLARTLSGDPGRYRRISRALDDAIDLSMRATRQSYRHVAPAYDAARDRMLLLLPLALVDDATCDCALALELMPSGAYQAASVVTLSRAYAAARVVSREVPGWLAPERVLA